MRLPNAEMKGLPLIEDGGWKPGFAAFAIVPDGILHVAWVMVVAGLAIFVNTK